MKLYFKQLGSLFLHKWLRKKNCNSVSFLADDIAINEKENSKTKWYAISHRWTYQIKERKYCHKENTMMKKLLQYCQKHWNSENSLFFFLRKKDFLMKIHIKKKTFDKNSVLFLKKKKKNLLMKIRIFFKDLLAKFLF